MARKELVILTDDLDNSEIDLDGVDRPTVRFGIDGSEYEIDLGAAHQKALRDAFERFVTAARRTGSSGARSTGGKGRRQITSTQTPASSRAENAAIREWAEASGIDVSARGRLPKEVVERYHGHFSEQNEDAAAPAEPGRQAPPKDQPAFSG